MRILLGLDPVALFEEYESNVVIVDGYVEDVLGFFQNGVGRGIYVSSINNDLGVWIPFLKEVCLNICTTVFEILVIVEKCNSPLVLLNIKNIIF